VRSVRSLFGGLLRRRGLFNGHFFDVGVFVLHIGLIQESVDDVSALLLLDPRFLRFRLFGEELVVDFPAHPRWLAGTTDTEMLKPAPDGYLQVWPVSRRVNSSRAPADDPSLVEQIAA
jgi:hypothetical protein